MRLACIVEGHGEVQAVPLLLRRLAVTLDPILDLQIEQPIRLTKSKLLQLNSGHYVETLDQPALAALFDLTAARRADSFDKCWREMSRLIAAAAGRQPVWRSRATEAAATLHAPLLSAPSKKMVNASATSAAPASGSCAASRKG